MASGRTSSDSLPNIFPCLYYRDASSAINWLAEAFGFVERLRVAGPGETIIHAEMTFGLGTIMLRTARPEVGLLSPRDLPGVNQVVSIYVEDPDKHHAQAKSAGAEITQELASEEHARGYTARDPEGNFWYFGTYQPGR